MAKLHRLFRHIKRVIKRFSGHSCVYGSGTVFDPAARIENIRGIKESITIGAGGYICGELLTFRHGGEITLGDDCYIGAQSRIWSARKIHIGNRVLISHLVSIFDNLTHPLDPKARHQQFRAIMTTGHPQEIDLEEKPVRIEDDAWIGAHSIILPGVTIGAAAVVGAGSVVTKDVEPYTVVAGNPAKFVKKIESNDA